MNLTYYNDNEPYVAKWLWNLIEAGEISNGAVDSSRIQDVQPETLEGFNRCHFFAGIGGWDLALKLAGWPEDQEVWTGSCPCQPFSVAGKRKGIDDPRHLWPEWFRLIRECRPPVVIGEQVPNAIGHGWIDGVFGDLEAEGYACGSLVLGAHSVGAPHIRQRSYWMAISEHSKRWSELQEDDHSYWQNGSGRRGDSGRMGESDSRGWQSRQPTSSSTRYVDSSIATGGWMGNSNDARSQGCCFDTGEREDQLSAWTPSKSDWLDDSTSEQMGRAGFPWQDCDYISCLDGKTRRIISRTQLISSGISTDLAVLCPTGTFVNRIKILRGIGNSIVPQVAAVFIKSVMDILYG